MNKSEKPAKKAAQPYYEVRPLLIAAAVLSAVFLLAGGLKSYKGPDYGQDILENVNTLESYAQREIYTEAPAATPRPRVDGNGHLLVSDIEAEKQKILTNAADSKAELQRRFRNAALIGDSFADDAVNHKFLDNTAVFAAIGARTAEDDPRVQKAIDMGKFVFIFTYGTNDMRVYKEKPEIMISRYRASIEHIRKSVPYAQIYIQAMFRMRDDKLSEYPYFDLYNEKLLEMCEELEVGFFDSSFIMEANPDMYENDGLHISRKIYGKWLTYIADVAGL